MIKRKGLAFLIDVVRQMDAKKPFVLKLVGDGPEKTSLVETVSKFGLENKVEFVGQVPYTEMQKLYRTSDIFVFPSLRETTGTVLFEAMANGLPTVTFNQNGAALLIDVSSGFKIDIDQSKADIERSFAGALNKLIDDPTARRNMGLCAYNRILKKYTWEEKCKEFYIKFLKCF